MRALITGFMFLMFVGSVMSGVMEGGGFATTRLTANHTAAVTTLTVSNTEGFLQYGYVIIGNEQVKYSGKSSTTLNNCTRGYNSTTAVSHYAGDKVYSPDTSAINSAIGFNVATTGTTIGDVSVAMVVVNFFRITLPRICSWDYSWLKTGSEWLTWLRLIFAVFTSGFVIYMAYMIVSLIGGVLQSAWNR